MRVELLNETLFRNLAHARDLIAAWVTDNPKARLSVVATCDPDLFKSTLL